MVVLFFHIAFILGPILLGFLCFVVLPITYFILGRRTVARLGFDRAGNVFMGLIAAFTVAAYLTPPRIVTRGAAPVGDMVAAPAARPGRGGAGWNGTDTEIDWAQTMLMLVFDPPVLLWIVAIGGVGVLALVSRESILRKN